MSEFGETMKALKAFRKQERDELTKPCEGCVKFHPKRHPSKLYPGQRCKWCKWKRPAEEVQK